MGSTVNPVRLKILSDSPRSFSALQKGALRWHCQVMQGPSGLPVARSQAITDSRWFVIATAIT
jgi:hypothetical protein